MNFSYGYNKEIFYRGIDFRRTEGVVNVSRPRTTARDDDAGVLQCLLLLSPKLKKELPLCLNSVPNELLNNSIFSCPCY